jgi:enoyl-CoA hydratase
VDLKRVADGGADYMRVFRPALSAVTKAVFDHGGPVVAAINGHAIAGGCVLAAACDLRLMSGGTIGLAEMRVGVPFPAIPLEVMRHLMGPGVVRLIWDAELYHPGQARAIGLIDEVVAPESLLDAALAAARRLAMISPEVFAYTKRQLQGPARLRLDAVSAADEDAATAMWGSPRTRAAINRFLDSLKQPSPVEATLR